MISFPHSPSNAQGWKGSLNSLAFDEDGIRACLLKLDAPVYVICAGGKVGMTNEGALVPAGTGDGDLLAFAAPLPTGRLGDPAFRAAYNTHYAYYAGAMANGIASEELVIALGKAGYMGMFGSGGLSLPRIEEAILKVQSALGDKPYGFNLLHNPLEAGVERRTVELYLKHNVRIVEAAAFLTLTPGVVHYRAAGLSQAADGSVEIKNRILAKVSRREVAGKFMQPAPAKLLAELVSEGAITPLQAELAAKVPVADDITVEADSGGHTDNRPLVCLIPTMLALRDELQAKFNFAVSVRVGGAGGIGTPAAALGAYMMGAAYIETGSINQSCVEAGTSSKVKAALAKAGTADVTMAPAADMFEMGVRVQVLKAGTMFAMRASRLFELYSQYPSLEAIPAEEREKLEKTIFKLPLADVWQDTEKFWNQRDPAQVARAQTNPKHKMALLFRWYLGRSSRWGITGEEGREMDYQIWCGPSMGTFNDWVRPTYLSALENRRAADVAHHLLTGAAYLFRLQSLRLQGVVVDSRLEGYYPAPAQ
jgi:trans-AT polyketide synthase/acyltransferase/oxidoreductase domain-containing protein